MASRSIDLTGQRFGHFQVIESAGVHRSPCGSTAALWLCRCDCGNVVAVIGKNLRSGKSTNCGCVRKVTLPASVRTHGDSYGCRLYRIYNDMLTRCYNPAATHYHRYGGRGITVCVEWLESYETFRSWALANGYRDDLTIDRRDNDGNYEPGNCRWVTIKENCRNRSHDYLKERAKNGK